MTEGASTPFEEKSIASNSIQPLSNNNDDDDNDHRRHHRQKPQQQPRATTLRSVSGSIGPVFEPCPFALGSCSRRVPADRLVAPSAPSRKAKCGSNDRRSPQRILARRCSCQEPDSSTCNNVAPCVKTRERACGTKNDKKSTPRVHSFSLQLTCSCPSG